MNRRSEIVWLVIFGGTFIWSAIHPLDYFLWFMEALPGLIGFALLAITYKRFKFTPLVNWLILFHAIVLFIGAHYSYSHVPLFDFIQDTFNQQRNNYDKFAHLIQGFVPAMILRELFIRHKVIHNSKWLFTVIVFCCLGFSGLYEIIEWTTTLFATESSTELIGMQGYFWDTQTDMLFALFGSILAQLLLNKYHNKQLTRTSAGNEKED